MRHPVHEPELRRRPPSIPTPEWRLRFLGPPAGVPFRLGDAPLAMEYPIAAGPWRQAPIQPAWFLNSYLEANLEPGPAGVILDGLDQLTPSRP